MNWSVAIKKLRNKLLFTQVELLEQLDVSYASVHRYENEFMNRRSKRKLKVLLEENRIPLED